MISFSLGHRAEFFLLLREVRRSTPMMAPDRSTRSVRAILFLFVLVGIPGAVKPASLEDSAKELARRIAASLPAEPTVSCEVRNMSSLEPGDVALVQQALTAALRDSGVRMVSSHDAAINILVTLSENPQGLMWTSEIRQGDATKVVLEEAFRSREDRPSGPRAPITLQSEKFWEGPEHILDAIVMDSANGRPLLVLLTTDSLLISADGPGIGSRVFFPSVQPVLRNPTGLLTQSGDEVVARFVQQICTVALDTRSLVECRPAGGREASTFTLLQGITTNPPPTAWGSQIVKIQTECDSDRRFLVTGPGDFTQKDFVQLYGADAAGDSPAGDSIGNLLSFTGPVMSLHASGEAATAIVHNLETGTYEAHHISVACR